MSKKSKKSEKKSKTKKTAANKKGTVTWITMPELANVYRVAYRYVDQTNLYSKKEAAEVKEFLEVSKKLAKHFRKHKHATYTKHGITHKPEESSIKLNVKKDNEMYLRLIQVISYTINRYTERYRNTKKHPMTKKYYMRELDYDMLIGLYLRLITAQTESQLFTFDFENKLGKRKFNSRIVFSM